MAGQIKILLVDDEERFLKTLSQRLGLRDFDVTTAENGLKAIEMAKNERFDLALVDLKMPGMGGEEVLKLLKANDPYIEVIILTGHGSIDSAVHCTRLGSYRYLQKPCKTEELLQVLKDAYQQRVGNKLRLGEEKMNELLHVASGTSALGILRKLRKMEEEDEAKDGS